MQQISPQLKSQGIISEGHNQKTTFINGLTECFSEYLANMFKDFGEVLEKKLEKQQNKIKQNEVLLKLLIGRLESRQKDEMKSLTSIQDSEANSNQASRVKQDSEANSNQASRVKSLSINSNKDSNQISQVNEALKRLQQGIEYLEASLTCLKSRKSIEDPQSYPRTQKFIAENTASSQMNAQQSAMSKIQKLASKISNFAKDSSIEQIQNQREGLMRPHHIQKSRSLINLSRRYQPLSCPKKYAHGLVTTKSHIQLQSQPEPSLHHEYTHIPQQTSIINQNSSILLQEQKCQSNKMPLINRSKTVLNQLLSLAKDQADANVIMFYLKKGFKTIGEMVNSKKMRPKQENRQPQSEYNQKRHEAKNLHSNNFSQYFSQKSMVLKAHNTIENHKNGGQTSSIDHTVADSESGVSWVKENYSSMKEGGQPERGMHKKMQEGSETSLNVDMSRQKRKFQRTSNDNKMLMLKGKLRSNC